MNLQIRGYVYTFAIIPHSFLYVVFRILQVLTLRQYNIVIPGFK